MSKYIDLMLALSKLWKLCVEDIDAEISESETFDFGRARDALSELPTIDIVHCKECKCCRDELIEEHMPLYIYCEKWNHETDFDGFCSAGERIDK